MTVKTSDSPKELKTAFTGFISLLGSSVISALGFIMIASNRVVEIESATAVFIILFVQWQILGLTIAKTGIEQVVFAAVTENANLFFKPAKYVYQKAMPLAGVFACVISFTFSPWAAVVAFGSIVLDTYSLIVMADLNARKAFKITALSNLLNYPLFFSIIFAVNFYGKLTVNLMLSAFLLSSLVRLLWLEHHRIVLPEMQEVVCKANVAMGGQQALNYLLFRIDQLLLAIVALKMVTPENAGMYVFLAKFPELVSGVMVVAGSVLFPARYIKYPFSSKDIFKILKKYAVFIAGYFTAILLAFYAYLHLWKGTGIPWHLVVPFFVHSLCIVLVNNISYSALRQGYLHRLLLNLLYSVLTGLFLGAIIFVNFNVGSLSLIVPAQLLLFVTLSLVMGWGQRKELYG